MNCYYCKKQTNNPKFCSKSCAVSQHNKDAPKRKRKIRTCVNCYQQYVLDSLNKHKTKCIKCVRYRSKTLEESKSKTLGDIKRQKHLINAHRSAVYAVVRQYCRKWNASMLEDKFCKYCKYNLYVEFCHIKPISSFPDSATLGEINHKDNIILLCRNCHWEFDNGYIKIS